MDYSEPFGVESIHLDSFRNFQSLSLTLGKGFNVLEGPNGNGKTNLLEAIYWVATTQLLRGIRDHEAIREGSERTEVRIELRGSGTVLSMNIERGARKRAALNGLNLPRAADLLGRLPCVCITAGDMEIVRGEPSERRMFLDMELSSRSPSYLRHLTIYKRALDQRNAIIKAARESHQPVELWETWEDQLAEHGDAIRSIREGYVSSIEEGLAEFHRRMGGGEGVDIRYAPKDGNNTPELLRSAYSATRGGDVQRGATTIGPHRDDLVFEIVGRDARLFASQGQQRTCVIALKLATLRLSAEGGSGPPLLLLDDIFSDLDEARRSQLVEIVLDVAGQTILTCTEVSSAGPAILQKAEIYAVREGTISRN